jgi:hypothetical protein
MAAMWVLVALFGLTGCGGSGSSLDVTRPQATTTVKVPIRWAERSRQLEAPSSALSAVITLEEAAGNGSDVAIVANRRQEPAAYEDTYPSPTAARVGVHLLRARFHAGRDGTGGVTGTVTATVQVTSEGTLLKADGSPLTGITTQSTIRSISVDPNQSVPVGQAVDIAVSVTDVRGDLIALSPGSVTLSVQPVTGNATIDSQGRLLGLRHGAITVVAEVDGVLSAAQTVNVSTPPQAGVRFIEQRTERLEINRASGRLWASVANAPNYGNSVIEIDPAQGQVTSSVQVGSAPGPLDVSDDGSTLYVGSTGSGQVRRVDLAAKAVTLTFNVGTDVFVTDPYVFDLAIQPSNPDVVAVVRRDLGSTGYSGPAIFVNGNLRPNQLSVYSGLYLDFSSPSELFSADDNAIRRVQVDQSGATETARYDVRVASRIQAFGDRLYDDTGNVFDTATGQRLGQFAEGFSYSRSVTVDTAANRAFVLTGEQGQATVVAYDLQSFLPVGSFTVQNIPSTGPNGPADLVRWGSRGLAFRSGSRVYFIDQAPGL